MLEAPATPLPADPDVQRYLAHVRFEKRLAARTLTLTPLIWSGLRSWQRV